MSGRTGATQVTKNSELYAKTEADTLAYLHAGYNVVEMWSHDFREAEKHPGFLMGLLKRRSALV